MANRRLLLIMLLMLPVILYWEAAVVWIGRQMGYDMRRPQATTQPVAPARPSTGPAGPLAAGPSTAPAGLPDVERPSTGPALSAAPAALRPAPAGDDARPWLLGSADPDHPVFALGVKLTPRGAGIESVTLNRYRQAVGSDLRYVFQQPYAGFEALSRPLSSGEVTVNIDGRAHTIDLGAVDWALESESPEAAVYRLDLVSDAGPVLRFLKSFTVQPREAARDKGAGYEVAIDLKFQNLTDRPVSVVQSFNGPNFPPKELDRGSDRHVMGGYLESGRIFRIRHDFLESLGPKAPTLDYTRNRNDDPLLWAGTSSVYFNAILRPDPTDAAQQRGQVTPDYVGKVEARVLDPENPNPQERRAVTVFRTTELSVPPGETVRLPARLFVGPRLRSLLNNPYYSALPLEYDETLVLTAGPCAWCTFQWLVNILVWLLGVIQFVVRDWGIAIIVLVLIVRALLHPITKRAQVNMMKMAKFGPEIERLKKKYGDNKDELNRAMMQFYKEHGATPIMGCLPMFLQMPIWIALFSALQSTFELRQAPFLQFGDLKLTWISDLSQPDHLIKFDHSFTLLGLIPVSGLNILPFLLAVVFWLQHKYTPKPPTMSPEQEQQQKIMQWMTLLFPVFLYGGPSGLNLYILASTGFGIIESKIIRDHIKKKEAEEAAGAVIVDAPDTPRGKRNRPEPQPAGPAAPQGWLARKMAAMQKRLEEVQRQAEQQQKGKKRRT